MEEILLTVDVAAKKSRVPVPMILLLLQSGKLPGLNLQGEQWLIPEKELKTAVDALKKRGTPAGEKGE